MLERIRGHVVVGADGSTGADRAIAWAAEQAAAEHRTLTVVHALDALVAATSLWSTAPSVEAARLGEVAARGGEEIVARAAEQAGHASPGVTVETLVRYGDSRVVLEEVARTAHLVVVGSRGRGPVASLLLGSTSASLAEQAACPVVVVRPQEGWRRGGGVVVGVDGRERSTRTLEFAYEQAALRRTSVTVVNCLWEAPVEGETPMDQRLDHRVLVAETMAGLSEKYPDVPAEVQIENGLADTVLWEHSRTADLVVVGRRKPGLIGSLVHSTLAASVVEHATCPVAVVPAEDGGAE
ncbi:universal stress protein [Nocardioides marmotae]|uniref:universal stress protein n=1 Tax=Nocardioides marmotae TaxID=2663857 RepID=UPI0012B60082|nr:universal stress protein [Nocardioides marmotae]MBC9733407.1 universal stress protein [Nocardioides marmotae]MTB84514.1 hypothetical protein [Nocardioides marmotae]